MKNINLRKLKKHLMLFSGVMGMVYIGFFLTRFRSYLLFHSVYAIFLLFLLGVFAVLFIDLCLEERERSKKLNINLSLYNFALFYSMTMGLFTILYYQGKLPRDLVTIRNILLALVSIDIIGILVLTWIEGISQGDDRQQKRPQAQEKYHKTLEGVLNFMEANSYSLHRETTNYFLESKREAKDLAMLSVIFIISVLIPLIINIERYVFHINLFLIQYGLALLLAIFFTCLVFYQNSLTNAKYSLQALERYEIMQDKVYIFLGCIHKKPFYREKLRREKYFYIYWIVLALIPITLVFFFGVIPPILRATRLVSLVLLVAIGVIYRPKLRRQNEYSQHIDAIENMEVRPLAHITQMSELDKNSFVEMYWPIVMGEKEVDYHSLQQNKL